MALALTTALAACGEQDIILTGERLDIRGGATDVAAFVNQARPISLPAAVTNAD